VSPVYLYFVACLSTGCEVVQERYDGGAVACSMEVRSIAARWIAEHSPGATLSRWGCRMGYPA
jgi:hypothetical protein